MKVAGNPVDFIGIGAQKSGTSWVYTCLYEHPAVCAPIKELHFFSRPRYAKGTAWYESHFERCDQHKIRGEFSTSYLYSKEAPERIHACYPNVKLIAVLRNPIDRAYSQYRNAIKAGEIPDTEQFDQYRRHEASVLGQGKYAEQLERYLCHFPREQILVLIYEDIEKNPIAFMKTIYAFLGIDTNFVSSMVHTRINVGRTPRYVAIERAMHHVAEYLRRRGFDRLVHAVRKSGITDRVRSVNTRTAPHDTETECYNRDQLAEYFRDDVRRLSALLGRNLNAEWKV